MTYYNFLVKSPCSFVLAGERIRKNAGDTLRVSESKGQIITEQRMVGYENLLFVGKDSENVEKPYLSTEAKELFSAAAVENKADRAEALTKAAEARAEADSKLDPSELPENQPKVYIDTESKIDQKVEAELVEKKGDRAQALQEADYAQYESEVEKSDVATEKKSEPDNVTANSFAKVGPEECKIENQNKEESSVVPLELPKPGSSWRVVKAFLLKAEKDNTITVDLVKKVLRTYPSFDSVQEEGHRILDKLES